MSSRQTSKVHSGDCREILRQYEDNHFHSIVTDPPYGLSKLPPVVEIMKHWAAGDDYSSSGGFMGKKWDSFVPGPKYWDECYRVLKPGGHMLVFGGTRTFDLLSIAIRWAGFEIRDCIMWCYGSGFPKSLNVSQAIDKAAGVDTKADERWVETPHPITGAFRSATNKSQQIGQNKPGKRYLYDPTPAAKHWDGWGTALKPAWEPIIVARKPLEGTVASNVLKHGTGGINVDGRRVGIETVRINTWDNGAKPFGGGAGSPYSGKESQGRYPANIIHDGSDEVVSLFPNAGGGYGKSGGKNSVGVFGSMSGFRGNMQVCGFGDSGSAARFFYVAKASNSDRNYGCSETSNTHPTVKPIRLMRYITRLVTPPNGIVLDPFAGSASTGVGAILEGFSFVGIDIEEEHCKIAEERTKFALLEMRDKPSEII